MKIIGDALGLVTGATTRRAPWPARCSRATVNQSTGRPRSFGVRGDRELGGLEVGTERLKEVIAAFHWALKKRTRKRLKLDLDGDPKQPCDCTCRIE
jgi:hypothetical protein